MVTRRRSARPLRGRSRSARGAAPSLPPKIDTVFTLPFHVRCISRGTSGVTNPNSIQRGQFAGMLGGIATGSTTVALVASSFRISKIMAWPASGGDVGFEAYTAGSAEQALVKDSIQVSTLPTGITVPTGGREFKPKRGTYLAMWQVVAVNVTDILFYYYSTAGSVIDFHGAMTLCSGQSEPIVSTVASAVAGHYYYLSPDGNTTFDLTPQGLQTTH